jgi:hypothetical protein
VGYYSIVLCNRSFYKRDSFILAEVLYFCPCVETNLSGHGTCFFGTPNRWKNCLRLMRLAELRKLLVMNLVIGLTTTVLIPLCCLWLFALAPGDNVVFNRKVIDTLTRCMHACDAHLFTVKQTPLHCPIHIAHYILCVMVPFQVFHNARELTTHYAHTRTRARAPRAHTHTYAGGNRSRICTTSVLNSAPLAFALDALKELLWARAH